MPSEAVRGRRVRLFTLNHVRENDLLKSSAGTGWVCKVLIRVLKNRETPIRIFNLLFCCRWTNT